MFHITIQKKNQQEKIASSLGNSKKAKYVRNFDLKTPISTGLCHKVPHFVVKHMNIGFQNTCVQGLSEKN